MSKLNTTRMSEKRYRNIRRMAGVSTATKLLAWPKDQSLHSLIITCYSRKTSSAGPRNPNDYASVLSHSLKRKSILPPSLMSSQCWSNGSNNLAFRVICLISVARKWLPCTDQNLGSPLSWLRCCTCGLKRRASLVLQWLFQTMQSCSMPASIRKIDCPHHMVFPFSAPPTFDCGNGDPRLLEPLFH